MCAREKSGEEEMPMFDDVVAKLKTDPKYLSYWRKLDDWGRIGELEKSLGDDLVHRRGDELWNGFHRRFLARVHAPSPQDERLDRTIKLLRRRSGLNENARAYEAIVRVGGRSIRTRVWAENRVEAAMLLARQY
jgi:hypothetical protein